MAVHCRGPQLGRCQEPPAPVVLVPGHDADPAQSFRPEIRDVEGFQRLHRVSGEEKAEGLQVALFPGGRPAGRWISAGQALDGFELPDEVVAPGVAAPGDETGDILASRSQRRTERRSEQRAEHHQLRHARRRPEVLGAAVQAAQPGVQSVRGPGPPSGIAGAGVIHAQHRIPRPRELKGQVTVSQMKIHPVTAERIAEQHPGTRRL